MTDPGSETGGRDQIAEHLRSYRVPLRYGEMRGTGYAYGASSTNQHDVLLVAIDPPTGGTAPRENLTVRVRPSKD